ncbi:MAG: hypothetical protein ACRCSK_07320 [Fusobacteriaceae bacterium]
MKVEFLNYMGWKNTMKISNGVYEVFLTTDVGPRVIKFSLVGEKNVFYEDLEKIGNIGGSDFNFFGGHRLWTSPQIEPRNSQPDNDVIDYEMKEESVILRQKTEAKTGIQKEIEFILKEGERQAKIIHRIYNRNMWEIELSAWALSIMDSGGYEIIPTKAKDTDCFPNRVLTFWPWSKQNDYRMFVGEQVIFLKQDIKCGEKFENSLKIGTNNSEGWAAYVNNEQIFVKSFNYYDTDKYPDMNSSFETFTNHFMIELETLSPLKRIKPDDYIEHVETWEIRKDLEKFIKEKNIEEDYKKFIDSGGIKNDF